MPRTAISGRVRALAIPLIAAAVLVWPLFAFRYPPMTDFASQEAIVWLLRHRGDASLYPPGLYIFNPGHPNQLFFLIAWLFSFLFGVHLACKVTVAISILAILIATSRLARHMNASPWAAIFATPIALGFTFYNGFVTNLLGIAALIFALPSLDVFASSPSRKRMFYATLWITLMYEAHESLLFLAIGALIIFAIARAKTVRDAAFIIPPILFGFSIVFAQSRYQLPLRTRANLFVLNQFGSVSLKFLRIPHVIFGGLDFTFHAGLGVLVVLALVLLRIRAKPLSADVDRIRRSLRTLFARHRFAILGASSFALYFAMPAMLNGASFVNDRYLPPAFILISLAIAIGSPSLPNILTRVVLSAIPLAILASLLPQYALADKTHEEIDAIESHIAKGSAVANLIATTEPNDVAFQRGELASRILEDRGGRMMNAFTDASISPVLTAIPYQWDEALARNNVHPLLFRPAIDLMRFRYVLVRTEDDELATLIGHSLEPEAHFVSHSGGFYLFESNITTLPLTAHESPSPIVPAETLLSRFRSRFHLVTGDAIKDVRVDDMMPLPASRR